MTYVYDDGGRAAAGYKGHAGDCVVRAIAIAAELPYEQVYRELFEASRDRYGRSKAYGPAVRKVRFHGDGSVSESAPRRRRTSANSPRNGVSKPVTRAYMKRLGWTWTPFGSGCKVHLRADNLPAGRIIASCSRHVVAVVDGIIRDTYDSSRGGSRCVYGYWSKP